MSRPSLIARPSSRLTINKTIVLVTGGNTGIGLEIVKSLAAQPNFQVLMGCRDTHKGEAASAGIGAPANVNPIQLDITDDESIDHAYKTIEQLFGRLDILINNAGSAGQRDGKIDRAPTDRLLWSEAFNVNAVSTGLLTETLIPLLQKSSLPKIIFISSKLGSIASMQDGYPCPNQPWYSASKAAINYMAAYYARQYPNFMVNSCCPGLRATGLTSAELNDETDPKLGAVNAVRLATAGPKGDTGTYSNTEGPIPW